MCTYVYIINNHSNNDYKYINTKLYTSVTLWQWWLLSRNRNLLNLLHWADIFSAYSWYWFWFPFLIWDIILRMLKKEICIKKFLHSLYIFTHIVKRTKSLIIGSRMPDIIGMRTRAFPFAAYNTHAHLRAHKYTHIHTHVCIAMRAV